MEQPDRITIGTANVLVSDHAVAVELGVSDEAARVFVEEIGLEWVPIGAKRYVGLGYLEAAIWWVTRPSALKREILKAGDVPQALMDRWVAEMEKVGYIYAGHTKAAMLGRLRRGLRPIRNLIEAEPAHLKKADDGRPRLDENDDYSCLPTQRDGEGTGG